MQYGVLFTLIKKQGVERNRNVNRKPALTASFH